MYFFLKPPTPSQTYTLSLHDALPISAARFARTQCQRLPIRRSYPQPTADTSVRSEEHTSELQSRGHLVCRLLLEKKNAQHSQPRSAYVEHHRPRHIVTKPPPLLRAGH